MYNYEYSVAKATKTGRKPLKTAGEMANEFGITIRQLCGYMSKDPSAPKPVLKNSHRCSVNARFVWYNPAELRKWWKTKKAKLRDAALRNLTG